jgi:L-iditol 2-dehydrogenase
MKAALLYGKEMIDVTDIETPSITDKEILLKVKSAAICGTDIRMFRNGYKGVDTDHPLVLGHEIAGIIEQVGKNVSGFRCGMRVAVAPNMGCGLCEWCVSGNTHLCGEYRALGINLDGGFAEYVRIPEAAIAQGNIALLDEAVSFDEAALNEPLSCVYNGFTQYGVNAGDMVLIIGAGPIGLMHAKLAIMAGAAMVMITDLSAQRLDVCRRIDSTFAAVENSTLKETVMRATKGRGLDVCVTACPAPSVQAEALELMAIYGRVNFFGGLARDKEIVPINTNLIHYKQLVITGSTRASVPQYRKTLGFISSGRLSVKELISGRFRLDQIKEALALAANAGGIKSVITFE